MGLKKVLLAVLLAALCGTVWLAIKRSEPPEVPFTRVRREALVSTIQTNGKVEPVQFMAARAERSGIIAKILVGEGQRVSQGMVIAELAPGAAASDLGAAQARVDEAQAELESLRRGGPDSELAAIDSSVVKAKSQLETARQELETLKRLAAKQAATQPK